MKKIFLVCLAFLASTAGSWAERIKVACVGNSITYGAGIANREKNSYPSQLQYYLGDGYEVKNFGSNGATALVSGDHPYVKTDVYKESKAFQPDIVLIKLGTNDTKPHNWNKEQFIADYQLLIDTYRSLESHPRIILLTQVRCFLTEKNTISPEIIEQQVRSLVEHLAWKNKLEIINLFNLFGNQWEQPIMPDRLHPSSLGAGDMAKKIGRYILNEAKATHSGFIPEGAVQFNFHGYQGYDFEFNGVACKIVKPAKAVEGNPWIWRARFWGHEPQTDIDLLEHGFHVVYCEVGDLYGADKAVKRWNDFYKYLVKNGFHKKAVLEGMSRGGLIVYNWAAQNPKKVACIYADAPVMDIKSWPMGKGAYEGSEIDIKRMLAAYGFDDEAEALKWKKNPLNHARKIAKAGIPVLHVVGDADVIVPVAENTAVFEKEMNALGTPITVIHKPGIGHHPHSLNNPEPIVRFILKSTGRMDNVCTYAVPGNEFRSAAGWTNGSEWHAVAEDIETALEGKRLKLLLLGNSITQGWGGSRNLVTYKPGKDAMDNVMGEGTWESAGISGDRTQNLLWRVRYGNYNRCRPETVVIAIGINNLIGGKDSAEDIAEGIVTVTEEACRQFPESKIVLLGLFPSGKEKDSAVRKQCDCIHEMLAKHSFGGSVQYVNPTEWFVDSDGKIKDGLYAGDYIHLTPKGYECVAEKLKKLLEK